MTGIKRKGDRTMNDNEDIEIVINKEYDYSNAIVDESCITYIANYCESIYNQFNLLIEEDEKRNEKIKYEYKNYNYKNTYQTKYEIKIKEGRYNTAYCKSYNSLIEYIQAKPLNSVEDIEIELNLSYKRGKNQSYRDYDNVFKIIFKPYDIKLTRKSNHNEQMMNQVEESLNQLLSSLPTVNTIFCSK